MVRMPLSSTNSHSLTFCTQESDAEQSEKYRQAIHTTALDYTALSYREYTKQKAYH